jgi:hypothetical protein
MAAEVHAGKQAGDEFIHPVERLSGGHSVGDGCSQQRVVG